MSRPFEPNGLMPDMTQFEQMTKAYRDAMPQEFASAVNLMAHPVAGFAAAGAIGLGMVSHAMGVWMGAVAGMAEVSHRMLADAADAADAPPAPAKKAAKLKLVSSTPLPEAAATTARTVAAEAERVVRKTVEAADKVVTAAKPAPVAKAKAADDLKAISGIGPKLEKVLNGLGISTYEQVAKLTKAEIARLDDQLGFSGRIERDDWLGQATKLAGK